MAGAFANRTTPGTQRGRAVQSGDCIGIVAPSGPVDQVALKEGVARLQSWGYRTLLGSSVIARNGYLAGTDSERAADFNAVWGNPDVAAVICARGGYGVMRMLEHIDWDSVRAQPKFFCGFSDITALHVALEKEAGLITFHGPMAAAFGDAASYNTQGLQGAMRRTSVYGTIPWPDPAPGAPAHVTIRHGTSEGRLAGGNLTLLCSLLGTPWEPDFTDRILILEDVDEAPYRVDRMLTQLRLAGLLDTVAGIVFGDSPSCMNGPEGKPSLTLLEVLADILGPLRVPLMYGFPCGHTAYRATLPLGAWARMDASMGTLTVTEPALA